MSCLRGSTIKSVLAVFAMTSLASISLAGPPRYIYYDLGEGQGNAVNINTVIAGEAIVRTVGASHAYVWQDGVPRNIASVFDVRSVAVAINSENKVVGTSADRPFVWEDDGTSSGRMTILSTPGDSRGAALAINDFDYVAGWSYVAPGVVQAALWNPDGSYSSLGAPPGGGTVANGLNNLGQVVGNISYTCDPDPSVISQLTHAFFWQDGVMIDLGAPVGYTDTFATDNNDRGQMVGYAVNKNCYDLYAPQNFQPVIWQVDGEAQIIAVPTGFSGAAFVSINNSGYGVGTLHTFSIAPAESFLYDGTQLHIVRSLIDNPPSPRCGIHVRGINDAQVLTGMLTCVESLPGGGLRFTDNVFLLIPV